MDAIETEQLLDDVASVVKHAVEQAVKPLRERIVSLEKQVAEIPEPRDGKDADLSEVKVLIDAELSGVRKSFGEVWPAGQVAKMMEDALAAYAAKEAPRLAEADIRTIAADEAEKRVSALPEPKDGQDGKDADPEAIKRMVDEAIAALPPAKDGKDGRDGIDGKDGEPGPKGEKGEPGRDGINGERGEKGETGRDGKDGIDAVDALIDKSGDLIFTFSDGRMKNVGCVVGMDGVDVDIDRVLERMLGEIKALWDAYPKPKDGTDGLGFDDMELLYDGERSVTLKFQRGEKVKELSIDLPVLIDRGVYREGQTYTRGDGVTWGGSFWICQSETTDKPDAGTKTWRLAVKKGRDAKPEPVKA